MFRAVISSFIIGFFILESFYAQLFAQSVRESLRVQIASAQVVPNGEARRTLKREPHEQIVFRGGSVRRPVQMKSEFTSFGMGEKMKNFDIVIFVIFLRRVVNLRALLRFVCNRLSHNRKDSITKQTKKDKKKMMFILLINLIKIEI